MANFHRNTNPEGLSAQHVPQQPFWLAIIRVIQGIFSILVLSLAASASSYYYLHGYGMAFFTFTWTVIFLLYIYLTPHFFPHAYHFGGHLVFEGLTTLFWLVTFALLADYTRIWSDIWGRFATRSTMISCSNAAMAFALLNWLLFCVTLAATFFLGRKQGFLGARVDGAHHSNPELPNTHASPTAQTNTTGGFFSSLFSGRKGRNTDVEKNHAAGGLSGGPVNETGQPVELTDRPTHNGVENHAYGHNDGYGNDVDGGYPHHDQGPPPPASYVPPPGATYQQGQHQI